MFILKIKAELNCGSLLYNNRTYKFKASTLLTIRVTTKLSLSRNLLEFSIPINVYL